MADDVASLAAAAPTPAAFQAWAARAKAAAAVARGRCAAYGRQHEELLEVCERCDRNLQLAMAAVAAPAGAPPANGNAALQMQLEDAQLADQEAIERLAAFNAAYFQECQPAVARAPRLAATALLAALPGRGLRRVVAPGATIDADLQRVLARAAPHLEVLSGHALHVVPCRLPSLRRLLLSRWPDSSALRAMAAAAPRLEALKIDVREDPMEIRGQHIARRGAPSRPFQDFPT